MKLRYDPKHLFSKLGIRQVDVVNAIEAKYGVSDLESEKKSAHQTVSNWSRPETQCVPEKYWPLLEQISNSPDGFVKKIISQIAYNSKVFFDTSTLDAPSSEGMKSYPIIGYIGNGDVVYNGDQGEPIDWTDPSKEIDFGSKDVICYICKGDSNYPYFRQGEEVFFETAIYDPLSMINKTVACLLDDGRIFLKILARGKKKGLYTLISRNEKYEPIEDVHVNGCLKMIDHIDRNSRI